MEDILNELYSTYRDVLNELSIGHLLNEKSLRHMLDLIHKAHFVKCENNANLEIIKILEYYEYI